MLHTLIFLDTRLFFFFNQTLANPVFDVIMPVITNLNYWKIPIAIIWILLIVKGGPRGRAAAVLIIPILICGDQISAFVIKPFVARLRPCHALEDVRLLVGCGGKYSFPSSHATNIAGMAGLFTYFYKRKWPWFWGIALMVGYSRIYVGVHYPGDVIFGMILGTTIAAFFILLYRMLSRKFPQIDVKSRILPNNNLV